MRIDKEIEKYLMDFDNNKLGKPEQCRICMKFGSTIWWSMYCRGLKTLEKVFEDIPIKRVRCTACGSTFSIVPDFIIQFCRYGKDVMTYVLKELHTKSYVRIADKISMLGANLYIATHTLFLWNKNYSLACIYSTA